MLGYFCDQATITRGKTICLCPLFCVSWLLIANKYSMHFLWNPDIRVAYYLTQCHFNVKNIIPHLQEIILRRIYQKLHKVIHFYNSTMISNPTLVCYNIIVSISHRRFTAIDDCEILNINSKKSQNKRSVK